MSGGFGDDRLDLRDGGPDTLICGEGADTSSLDGHDYFTQGDPTPEPFESIGAACENVQRNAPAGAMATRIPNPVGVDVDSPPGAAFLGCPGDGPATCAGSARVDVAGRPGQAVSFSIPRNDDATVDLPYEKTPGEPVRGDLVVETNLPGVGVSRLLYRDALVDPR